MGHQDSTIDLHRAVLVLGEGGWEKIERDIELLKRFYDIY